LSLNIFAKPDGVKARLMLPRRKQVLMRIFARPDRGTAQSARLRLKDVIMVDRTAVATGTAAAVAEIAALRQKLAAAAARIQVEMGRHKETEAHKDNPFKPFTSWKSDKIKSVPTLDDAWLHFCAT
jgi:hypothetical protein